jgi:uncharacterized membrane-anchored protein
MKADFYSVLFSIVIFASALVVPIVVFLPEGILIGHFWITFSLMFFLITGLTILAKKSYLKNKELNIGST